MISKLLASIATVSALSIGSTAFAAAIVINPSAPAGTFENQNVICTGSPCLFSDSGTFATPVGFNRVGATVTSGPSTQGSDTDIDFITGFLNGTAFSFPATGVVESGFVLPVALMTGSALNTLTFTGKGFGNSPSGSYSGTLTFTNVPGVPEPSTWAMMLLGFGMLGFSLRRRAAAQPRVNFAM